MLSLVLSGCAPFRAYEAVLVLADIAAGPGPSRLKQVTPAPRRQAVKYGGQGADLYLPTEPIQAGVLLIPGAVPQGKDDPRLVAFAETLARVRFAVLVPDLSSVRSLTLKPGDAAEVAAAFYYLTSRPDLAPRGRAGMVALSYAVGPALLAAMEPAIRERVRFVVAIGGYYDLPAVLTFFTTGYFRDAGEWRYLGSNPYASWIFVRSNLERLESGSDRETLASMASRRLADPQASLADLAAQLGPEGRAVYGFVNHADPDRAPALFQALPASVRQDVAALDLRNKDLRALSARLILVHGRGDTMIPYTQSVALARAVSPGQAKLFLAGGLGHVELQGRWWEAWTLWRAASALLSERDQG